MVSPLLILFFFNSHPNVDGVLLWGFWDQKIFASSAALVNGKDFVVSLQINNSNTKLIGGAAGVLKPHPIHIHCILSCKK